MRSKLFNSHVPNKLTVEAAVVAFILKRAKAYVGKNHMVVIHDHILLCTCMT